MPATRYQSAEDVDIRRLTEPLTFEFSGRVAKNRLMKAAMEERLATWDDRVPEKRGIPTVELIELYKSWGEQPNTWGITVTGNITIDYEHVAGSGDPIITPEDGFSGPRFEGFKAIAAAAKAQGSLVIGQVNHPGRQAQEIYVKEPISASDIQLEFQGDAWTFGKPRAATQADIARVIDGFAHAAQYLERAGFDGINLHAAHGYLLAQFLSRRTNRRTDAYGGSLTNRMRLLVEVVGEIRRRVSRGFVVSAKLNSTDFQEDGLQPAEARELVAALQEGAGLDFVELSGGTYEHMQFHWTKESTRKREAFFLEFAETIVPGLGADRRTKVFLTGGLRSAAAMVGALDVVDGVGLARPAAQEPRLAADIVSGRVAGAIRPVPPFDNASELGLLAAGVQLRQIAEGMEPFDLSDEEAVKDFWKSLEDWKDKSTHRGRVGNAVWTGKATPYGAVKVAV